MTTRSIRKRLLWTVALSQALLALGLVLAGVFYTHLRLRGALDASLQARAVSLSALVRFSESGRGLVFESGLLPRPIDGVRADMYEVRVEGVGTLVRSPNWNDPLTVDCSSRSRYSSFLSGGTEFRALCLKGMPILDREESATAEPPKLTIVYATPLVELRREVHAAGVYIALASLILLGGTIPLAFWGVRRGLLPLQHIAEQASQVSPQNWEFRSPADADATAELQPLTRAMETMLERLHQSFLQQREFLGNAAHELKTPVTILKSTLQSLLQKPRNSEEYRTGLERALEDMERLEKLLHWMLRLARAEQWARGTLQRDLAPIELTTTCEEAIEGLRPLAQSKRTEILLTTESPAVCRVDPEDVELVWVNLLENAIRYSPEGSAVQVRVGRENSAARVEFDDRGPGIPAEVLPHVFERFHRGDPSRARETGGYGLGLAIAKALVEAYGGTITAASAPGQGTQMTVRLPLCRVS